MFSQCGRPGVQNVTTRQHLRKTFHRKIAMKTVTKYEAASHDDEVAPSDVVHIVVIATFMKQPFSDTDFLSPTHNSNIS